MSYDKLTLLGGDGARRLSQGINRAARFFVEKGKSAVPLLRALLSVIGICAAVLANSPLRAQKIDGYRHTGWTVEDGVPAPVRSLSQSPDGFLWIAAGDGTYRFDGVTFEKMPGLRDPELGDLIPRTVHASPSGDIWIGYSPGAVALYRHGSLRDMHMPNPPEFVIGIEDDDSGGLWVMSGRDRGSLSHFARGQWREIGEQQGIPQGQVHQVFVARDGTTWVVQSKALLYLARGAKRFVTTPAKITLGAAVAQGPDGRLWLADRLGVRPLPDYPRGAIDRALPERGTPNGALVRLAFDRAGNLWSVDRANGLSRTLAARLGDQQGRATPAFYKAEDSLTSDRAISLLLDREGNIWVGTESGLDRLRAAVVHPQKGMAGVSTNYGAGSDANGIVYLLADDGIYAVGSGSLPKLISHFAGQVSPPCRLKDGSAISATPGHFLRLALNGVRSVPGPDEIIYGCVQDARGRLWITSDTNGLSWLDKAGWHALTEPPEASQASDLTLTSSGTALARLGYKYLLRLDQERPTLIKADALGVGAITSVSGGLRDVLVGGVNGLARLRDNGVRVLLSDQYPWLKQVRALTQTSRGDTWMLAPIGIIRVATSDLNRAFDRPGSPLPHDLFDAADGLKGRMQRDGMTGSQILEGADHAVRFLTTAGVVAIDPDTITHNTLPPPVVISSIISRGVKFVDPTSVTLRPGSASIEIAYTALSLSVPERVRFHYMLEGVDDDWIDPGTRRVAVYGNLAPGTYRFRVIAANNDGVWNRTGATVLIKVPPTFLQSIWFKLICGAAVVAVLWWGYALRVRHVTGRLRAAMGIRLAERERIARELHDTLLQTFQGLVLQFQAAANRFPAARPAREALDRALRSADAALVEGRNRVRELRVENTHSDLVETWVALAAELGGSGRTQFALTVEGKPRDLYPLVHEELQRLGEEALRNAFQHANASQISATLTYRNSQLLFHVRDDGIGMPREIAARGERTGHYGLIGMRERARRIGGELSIVSREGAGTEVLVSLPGKTAYAKRGSPAWIPAILTTRWESQ
jgi:signal transduction histidine kinase/ligand-binding sensor domain-containing protein